MIRPVIEGIAVGGKAVTDHIKRPYGIGAELPTDYVLVINTEKLAPERAAELIVRAAGGRADAQATAA
jgi:hypothetical protein